MGSYFAEDRKIILLVAIMLTDGDPRSDGTWDASLIMQPATTTWLG